MTHTSAVLTEVDDIAALAETAIAVQRGYLLSGDRSLRIQFLELKAEIPHRVRNLNSMVQYKPVAERLAKLELKLRRRLTLAANTVDAYDRDGLLAAQAQGPTAALLWIANWKPSSRTFGIKKPICLLHAG